MTSTISADVAKKLRNAMEFKGFTTAQLADRLGVSHATLIRRLSGKSLLTLEQVEEICEALAVALRVSIEGFDGWAAPSANRFTATIDGRGKSD
jgi:transcriptional regulator with XRE-family HTH domain